MMTAFDRQRFLVVNIGNILQRAVEPNPSFGCCKPGRGRRSRAPSRIFSESLPLLAASGESSGPRTESRSLQRCRGHPAARQGSDIRTDRQWWQTSRADPPSAWYLHVGPVLIEQLGKLFAVRVFRSRLQQSLRVVPTPPTKAPSSFYHPRLPFRWASS